MAEIAATIRARVVNRLAATGALPAGSHVLLAVSGGVDSTVLLDVMAAIAPALDVRLSVLHVDHGLRPGSAAEAAHVRALAEQHALPFHGVRIDVARRRDGGASEEAARDARRSVFRAVASEVGADAVATGHTADDQAETVLLRLGRGVGPRGLAAMAPADTIGGDIPGDELRLVRPLLAERRADLIAYARARALTWLDDPSNASDDYLRNRVRHTLVPQCEALFGDGFVTRVAALAEDLGEERAARAALVGALEGVVWRREPDDTLTFDGHRLRALPQAARRHVLVHALESLGLRRDFSRRHLAALARLADSEEGSAALALPGDLVAERTYGALRLGPPRAPEGGPADGPLPGPGRYEFGELIIELERVEGAAPGPRGASGEAWVDATTDPLPLALRRPRPGERVSLAGVGPAGRAGHRKVSRLLVDRKVPRNARDAVRLLVDRDDRPLWVLASTLAGASAGELPRVEGGEAAEISPAAEPLGRPTAGIAPAPGIIRTGVRRIVVREPVVRKPTEAARGDDARAGSTPAGDGSSVSSRGPVLRIRASFRSV